MKIKKQKENKTKNKVRFLLLYFFTLSLLSNHRHLIHEGKIYITKSFKFFSLSEY